MIAIFFTNRRLGWIHIWHLHTEITTESWSSSSSYTCIARRLAICSTQVAPWLQKATKILSRQHQEQHIPNKLFDTRSTIRSYGLTCASTTMTIVDDMVEEVTYSNMIRMWLSSQMTYERWNKRSDYFLCKWVGYACGTIFIDSLRTPSWCVDGWKMGYGQQAVCPPYHSGIR